MNERRIHIDLSAFRPLINATNRTIDNTDNTDNTIDPITAAIVGSFWFTDDPEIRRQLSIPYVSMPINTSKYCHWHQFLRKECIYCYFKRETDVQWFLHPDDFRNSEELKQDSGYYDSINEPNIHESYQIIPLDGEIEF